MNGPLSRLAGGLVVARWLACALPGGATSGPWSAAATAPRRWIGERRSQSGDEDRGQDAQRARERERKAKPEAGSGADRTDHRTDDEAAHLERGIEPERLASLPFGRPVDDDPARRRVVHAGRATGQETRDEQGRRTREEQRHEHEDPQQHEAADHQQTVLAGPVCDRAEQRLGEELGERPGRGDHAVGVDVDAVLGGVQRQHREQRAEAEQDDELGNQQGQDRAPTVRPGASAGGHAGRRPAFATGLGHARTVREPSGAGRDRQLSHRWGTVWPMRTDTLTSWPN